MTNLIKYFKRFPSILVIVVLIISCIWVNGNIAKWNKKEVIDWDVTSYYSYLPAFFLKKDLSLKFFNENPNFYKENRQFSPQKCPNGNNVIKTSMGMSLMYLPFFAIAHVYANTFGYNIDGFSEPYQFMVQFSGLVYLLIGLYYLRRLLLLFFTEKVVALTLLFVVFGTNLFYYTSVHGAMPHVPVFCLGCIFIWYSLKWMTKPDWKNSLVIGLVLGLIVLIRPINVLLVLFFVVYGVTNSATLKQRLVLFIKQYQLVFLIGFVSFMVFIPQLLYWKHVTGSYFFNSYVGERFFFAHPHLLEGLFGFRKGWLLYTPIMIFSLIGIIQLFLFKKEFSWAVAILFVVYTYVIMSWWCWWYGGSYSCRAIVDIYPFLTIAMAVFVNRMIRNRMVISVMLLLVLVNCFQMFQYRRGVIHYNSMTKEAYFDALFRIETSPRLKDLISHPNDDKARMTGTE